MNELRMYVEKLFEGRVLTAETIELKEEIYGNLVARYEDLIAEGASEADALDRTKESITSIDDVLADVASTAEGELPTEGRTVVEPAADPAAAVAPAAEGHAAAGAAPPAEDHAAAGAVPLAEAHAAGGPTPPSEAHAAVLHPQPEQKSKHKPTWPMVLVCAVVLVLFVVVGFGGCSVLTAYNSLVEQGGTGVTVTPLDPDANDLDDAADAATHDAQEPSRYNREIFVDENGQVWIDGEPGDELAAEVAAAQVGAISEYANTNLDDASRVEALLRALPMAAYVTDVDVTRAVDTLSLAYREIPDALSGDSVDAALAYNVTAVFCAMPLVNEIQVTVTESDDPLDESYYVFTRDAIQERYGVRLDDAMLNESGWRQIREDNLYQKDFIERMVDSAEQDWK